MEVLFYFRLVFARTVWNLWVELDNEKLMLFVVFPEEGASREEKSGFTVALLQN